MLNIINKEKKGKENYVLIKDFNTFRYNDTLHHRIFFFFFCCCALQAFNTEEI